MFACQRISGFQVRGLRSPGSERLPRRGHTASGSPAPEVPRRQPLQRCLSRNVIRYVNALCALVANVKYTEHYCHTECWTTQGSGNPSAAEGERGSPRRQHLAALPEPATVPPVPSPPPPPPEIGETPGLLRKHDIFSKPSHSHGKGGGVWRQNHNHVLEESHSNWLHSSVDNYLTNIPYHVTCLVFILTYL